jgi:hypothetical protein
LDWSYDRVGALAFPNFEEQFASSLVFASSPRDVGRFILPAYEDDATVLNFFEEWLSAPVHFKFGEVFRNLVAQC